MSAKEITRLRERAEAIGCHVRVFRRKDYRFGGKLVRYSVVEPAATAWDINGHPHRFQQEWFAANLIELRGHIERVERWLVRR